MARIVISAALPVNAIVGCPGGFNVVNLFPSSGVLPARRILKSPTENWISALPQTTKRAGKRKAWGGAFFAQDPGDARTGRDEPFTPASLWRMRDRVLA